MADCTLNETLLPGVLVDMREELESISEIHWLELLNDTPGVLIPVTKETSVIFSKELPKINLSSL